MRHDKLVRDGIPSILADSGLTFTSHIATDEEFWPALKQKLQEEVNEFIESENKEEIADIFEVIRAIASHQGWTQEELETLRKIKSKERGGFTEKIILEYVNTQYG